MVAGLRERCGGSVAEQADLLQALRALHREIRAHQG